mgnify:CR=1 FL=1
MSLEKYFPYATWRKHQREIAEAVRKAVEKGEILLLEAPTGVGKTSAVLAGVLSAIEDSDIKVFFTARTKNQAMAPFRELKLLQRKGVHVFYSLFRSKKEMCSLESTQHMDYEEFLEFCKEKREQGCVYSTNVLKLTSEDLFDYCLIARSPIDFIEKCRFDELCPYEAARRLVQLGAKVIIGSYPYIFDPKVQQSFFSMTGLSLDKIVLVVDEAHNLPSSLSNMLSIKMPMRLVRLAKKEASKYRFYDLARDCSRLIAFYKILSRKISDKGVLISIDDILTAVRSIQSFVREAEALTIEKRKSEKVPKSRCYVRYVAKFLKSLLEYRRGYVLSAKAEEGEVVLEYRCISPSGRLEQLFSSLKACILMSATLQPKEFLSDILGLPSSRIKEKRVGEIFPKENRLVLVASDVTSRYSERSDVMFERICEYISSAYEVSPENKALLVVVPSYEFLKPVKRLLRGKPLIIEDESTRIEDVISAVQTRVKTIVLAVAGGKIVEGIEIKSKSESLISTVIIAGIPYPEPDIFNSKLKELISIKYSNRNLGWEYAFAIPAAMKIKQAAGRAIRSEKDKAAIIILDRRILTDSIKKFLPDLLENCYIVNSSKKLSEKLSLFFCSKKN